MLCKLIATQYLWTCQHIGVHTNGNNNFTNADRTAVEWFKIQTTPSVSIADHDRIYDNATTGPKFCYFPSLAVNKNGDMVIGFSGSNDGDRMSAYYWAKLNNGTSPTSPILYYTTTNAISPLTDIPGGDYSYTSLDPVDGITFWTIQEYAETNSPPPGYTWGTVVGRVAPY
jgi:hypothetical protein